MDNDYIQFLATKAPRPTAEGLRASPDIGAHLFPFQRHCAEFALRVGRCGLFLDTGLGKTLVLFVYSDSIADMGNSSTNDEFDAHYRFCAEQLRRLVRPGRIVAVHCSDLPSHKWKDGYIGVRPFSDQPATLRYVCAGGSSALS